MLYPYTNLQLPRMQYTQAGIIVESNLAYFVQQEQLTFFDFQGSENLKAFKFAQPIVDIVNRGDIIVLAFENTARYYNIG